MGQCIAPKENSRFDLRLGPDGVYRVDGRIIPIADNSTLGINNSKPVIGVHGLANMSISQAGVELGVDVKQ